MTMSNPTHWLEEHGSALYSFAFLHVRDTHRAEDLVQETLLAALNARERFQGGSSVRTWLTGILKHKIMDEYRRQAREVPLPNSPEAALEAAEALRVAESFTDNGKWSQPPADWGDAEQSLSRTQLWSLIEQCLEALSPRMARLFVLRELWEMETDEVCKELDMTPTNLWTTLHRSRLGMRRCLEKHL
jgi:RNA polymerase sigma-70 factor (ECF subfamily)